MKVSISTYYWNSLVSINPFLTAQKRKSSMSCLMLTCSLLSLHHCELTCSAPIQIPLLVVATAGPSSLWLHNRRGYSLAPSGTGNDNSDCHFSLFALSFWIVNSFGKWLALTTCVPSLEQSSPWLRANSKLNCYCLTLPSEDVKGGWELMCHGFAPFFFVQWRLLISLDFFRIILLYLFHSYAIRRKKSASFSL